MQAPLGRAGAERFFKLVTVTRQEEKFADALGRGLLRNPADKGKHERPGQLVSDPIPDVCPVIPCQLATGQAGAEAGECLGPCYTGERGMLVGQRCPAVHFPRQVQGSEPHFIRALVIGDHVVAYMEYALGRALRGLEKIDE